MSALSDAINRFNLALDQLETSVESHIENAPVIAESNTGPLEAEITRLRDQRERLVTELETERTTREEMITAKDDATERLDFAVGQLRRALGS